jgi:hypothetical protein
MKEYSIVGTFSRLLLQHVKRHTNAWVEQYVVVSSASCQYYVEVNIDKTIIHH